MGDSDAMVHLVQVGDNGEASVLRSFLECHDIHVYVQGENHRSVLGMVGAFIELKIMVPASQLDDAKELLEEYNAETPEGNAPTEFQGPNRDEFDDQDADDNRWLHEKALSISRRRLRIASFVFPFGGGHFAMGAWARGLLLLAIVVASLVAAVSTASFLLLWPLAIVMDLYGAGQLFDRKALPSRKKTKALAVGTSEK